MTSMMAISRQLVHGPIRERRRADRERARGNRDHGKPCTGGTTETDTVVFGMRSVIA